MSIVEHELFSMIKDGKKDIELNGSVVRLEWSQGLKRQVVPFSTSFQKIFHSMMLQFDIFLYETCKNDMGFFYPIKLSVF